MTILSITQVDYRNRDGEWDYFYRVVYANGREVETSAWHPDFAGHEIKVIKG